MSLSWNIQLKGHNKEGKLDYDPSCDHAPGKMRDDAYRNWRPDHQLQGGDHYIKGDDMDRPSTNAPLEMHPDLHADSVIGRGWHDSANVCFRLSPLQISREVFYTLGCHV